MTPAVICRSFIPAAIDKRRSKAVNIAECIMVPRVGQHIGMPIDVSGMLF